MNRGVDEPLTIEALLAAPYLLTQALIELLEPPRVRWYRRLVPRRWRRTAERT